MEQVLSLLKPEEQTYSGSLTDVFQKGGQTFQRLLTAGQAGELFGPGTSLLQGLSGNGFQVSDETGGASLSPYGDFQIAGKYGGFGINPFQRKVSASYTNPNNTFSIDGSYGMGPQGFYDPTGNINFRFGQGPRPVMAPNQIQIGGLPSQNTTPSVSEAREFVDNQANDYYTQKRLANPNFYKGVITAPPEL